MSPIASLSEKRVAMLYQSSFFVLHLVKKPCDQKKKLQTLFGTPVSRFYVDVFAIVHHLLSRYPVTKQRFALATSGIRL